jgi:hypothetical protein
MLFFCFSSDKRLFNKLIVINELRVEPQVEFVTSAYLPQLFISGLVSERLCFALSPFPSNASDCIFDAAEGILNLSFHGFCLAVRDRLLVADHLAYGLFDVAGHRLCGTDNTVLVHRGEHGLLCSAPLVIALPVSAANRSAEIIAFGGGRMRGRAPGE